MARIIGIAGSLRKRSYNRALLRAAVELAPEGLEIEIASIDDIPLYDGDVEQVGTPTAVTDLKRRIAAADGVLLVSPEYNQSIPGVLKNAIDWLSRSGPDNTKVFDGKPVALIGATPGRGGTRMSQAAWLPVFKGLGVVPFFGKQLYVAGAGSAFDDELTLADEMVTKLLTEYLSSFHGFVQGR